MSDHDEQAAAADPRADELAHDGPRGRSGAGFWTIAGVAAALMVVWWAILQAVDADDVLRPDPDPADADAVPATGRSEWPGSASPFDGAVTRGTDVRSAVRRSKKAPTPSAGPGAGGNMPGSRLDVAVQDRQQDTAVVLVGDLDAHTAGDLDAVLDGLESPDKRVVLDMRSVEFIDSAGLGVIIRHDQQREPGLVLINLNDRVLKVLEYAGLVGHLTIE